MNIAYFFSDLVGRPASAIDGVVDTLASIWERTIFLRPSTAP
jgi:hypothetical protein